MDREEIFDFLNENPVFYLATCEGNEPRVRGMRLYQANEHGIFFNTSKDKSLFRQLSHNPSVELCFYDGKYTQVRIRGTAQLAEGTQFKEQMCRQSPEMSAFIKGDKIAIFWLKAPKVKVWKMDGDYTLRLMQNLERDSIWMAMYMGDEDS